MVFIKNTKKGSKTRVFEPFLNLFSIGTGSHYARPGGVPPRGVGPAPGRGPPRGGFVVCLV